MAKILTNDTNTTPQAGGSICVVKRIEVAFTAGELVNDAVFNVGAPPPNEWKFVRANLITKKSGELDSGLGLRMSLGIEGAPGLYTGDSGQVPMAVSGGLSSGFLGMGKQFSQEDLIVKIPTAPTTAADGTLVILIFGYA